MYQRICPGLGAGAGPVLINGFKYLISCVFLLLILADNAAGYIRIAEFENLMKIFS